MLIAQVAAAKQHFFHQVQPPRVVGVQFSVCHGGVLLGRNDWMMVVLPVQVMSGCPESLSCGLLSCAKNLFEQANRTPSTRHSVICTTSRARPAMFPAMKQLIRQNTALRRLYYRLKLLRSKGQSNESRILSDLANDAPRTFVEFGFHPIEFNCAALARNVGWRGLLIDGNLWQVEDARAILPNRVEVAEAFLTLDNLDFIRSKFPQLGVLSIDVDGNDYWLLKALIEINPTVICIEYNASFGLEPVSVPYDPTFDRRVKHPSGWYHGASLIALAKLCASNGYRLAAISDAGTNAFFTRTGKLDPTISWRPNALRDKWSGKSAQQQYLTIRGMPLVEV